MDLDRENFKYLTVDADKSVRNLYQLHSVLVHSGGVHGGHYYAFIRYVPFVVMSRHRPVTRSRCTSLAKRS